MKLSDLKLAIVYVNLAHREDRRAETEYQLFQLGLTAQRQPGIKAAWVRDPWGFQNERRYACSLAKRLAIRRGFQTGAEAVLLLEDDVVFHPEFHDRLAGIELPENWGLFYLGCRHCSRPRFATCWPPPSFPSGMASSTLQSIWRTRMTSAIWTT